MREFITKRIMMYFFGGIILLTAVDYFVNSPVEEIGLPQIGTFIINNTILMLIVLAAYIGLKYLQNRGKASK